MKGNKMEYMKRVLLLTGLLALPVAAIAHSGVESKHGGVVSIVQDVGYELVAKADSMTIYIEDHGKQVDTKTATAKMTILSGKIKSQVNLVPAGENKLEAKGKFEVVEGTKVVSIISFTDKPAATVRFEIKQHDAHADHDHGGVAEQTAFGIIGDPAKVTRAIKLNMTDNMRFIPDNLTIKQGETVKFMITNQGKILHEMVIGTLQYLQEHAEMMRKMPDMQHDDPNMVRVKPSSSGEIIWTFNKSGHFDFACLQPSHSEAGMIGKLNVVASGS
jgi:uncharacterized cupredoxin-like copper-binding protein